MKWLLSETQFWSFHPSGLRTSLRRHNGRPLYVLLHGVIQLSAYHAGQIAILKRVIAESRTSVLLMVLDPAFTAIR